MNKKIRKLINNPKAYFYDYFRKQIRNNPKGPVSIATRIAFAHAKTDLGYGKEIRRYLKEGNLDFAERICLEGMSVVPRAIRPYIIYAEISMRKGGGGYFKEAIRRWKTVAEKFPNKPEGYAGEERAYVAMGDFEHAEVLCKNSIKNMPQELWPYIELAEISMRQGDFSEALRRWATVREKFPNKVPGYVRASVACCSLEKFAEAEEFCRECMRVAPGDYRPYAEYAEVSLRQGDFDEGLERCQTVRERFPGRADGYVRAAWAYMEMHDYAKADDFCRQSMEAAPKDIRSFSEYAEICMRQRDFYGALERWSVVREKFPKNALGYVRGSVAYCELENFTEAEKLCKKCMDAVPNDIRTFAEYAEISLRQGDFPTAVERWNTVRETFPRESAGYIRGAYAYSQIKDFSRAEELCRNYMEINPSNISSFTEYAEISVRKSNFKDAANRWRIVRDKFPEMPHGYLGEARTYIEQRDLVQAEKIINQGIGEFQNRIKECIKLYFLLITVLMYQNDRDSDLLSCFKQILYKDKFIIFNSKYYGLLIRFGNHLITTGEENKNSKSAFEFVILQLLRQHIDNSQTAVWIHSIYLTHFFKDRTHIQNAIDGVIKNYDIRNLISRLALSHSDEQDKIEAHLQLIERFCFIFNIKLCVFNNNQTLLAKACEIAIKNSKYIKFDKYQLFEFVRTCVFANQNMADDFIELLFKEYGKLNLPESNPIGLLCHRFVNRKKLLKQTIQYPVDHTSKTKSLNIAVCISGQLRGFKDNLSDLIEALDLRQHNYKVFVHTWKNIGLKFNGNANSAKRTFSGEFLSAYIKCIQRVNNPETFLKENYPNFYRKIVSGQNISETFLKEYYGAHQVVIEDDEEEPFTSFTNAKKMHYKIYAAHELAEQDDTVFDLEIRIRPDLHICKKEDVDLVEIYRRSINNASIFTPRGISGLTTHLPGYHFSIDDTFAIGAFDVMKIYADSYTELFNRQKKRTYACHYQFAGHQTIENNLFFNGVHIEPFLAIKNVMEIYPAFKNPSISKNDIYTALCRDVETRNQTADDVYLLDALKKDINSV